MKKTLYSLLKRFPALFRITRRLYQILFKSSLVVLSHDRLPPEVKVSIEKYPVYNEVLTDLMLYTGFSSEELEPFILRHPRKHFLSEFNWIAPADEKELTWYYRSGSAYLFANAVHPYEKRLDVIHGGKVLDYGAGAGCNTIGLAKRDIEVDFLEIGRVQADFINFRARRHNLVKVKEILPYHENKFDPINCIQDKYDAIILMDVLEHIPNYHILLRHLISCLKPGGLIVENSPFSTDEEEEIGLHVPASISMEEAMIGMEQIDEGIWKKK